MEQQNRKKLLLIPLSFLFFIRGVQAHCPLCTVGAATVAGGAVWLGLSKAVVGLFIGAFAVSTGWWAANMIKKQYIPFQKSLIILASFLLTIIPLLPIIKEIYPLYISLGGDYGSLLNRTYIFDLPLMASILGGIVVSVTPFMSKTITQIRNGKALPFQGIFLTLLLLIIAGTLIEVIL